MPEIKIPTSVTATVTLIFGTGKHNKDEFEITDYYHGEDNVDFGGVNLGEQEITMLVPKGFSIDGMVQLQVKGLKNRIDREKADSHMRIQNLQDEINKLLAIEYNPEETNND